MNHFTISIRTTLVSRIFRQFGSCFGLFDIAKQDRKLYQRLAFLPLSKARTNKLYIFLQDTYIVYVIP